MGKRRFEGQPDSKQKEEHEEKQADMLENQERARS